MNCENYQTLLSEFVDGALTAEHCASVELHRSARKLREKQDGGFV